MTNARQLGGRALLAIVIPAVLWSGSARAQEAPPIPLSIAFSPSGEPVAMRALGSGLVVRAQDDSWRLLCAGALGASGNMNFFVSGRPGGGLLVGQYRGLQYVTADFCEQDYLVEDLRDRRVVYGDKHGDTLLLLSAGQDNRYALHRSDDGGGGFALLSELPADVAFFTLSAAPSDLSRLYMTAVPFDPDSGVSALEIYRSDDGGASYRVLPLALENDAEIRLVGVDPADPDRVYLAVIRGGAGHGHGNEEPADDQVFVSDDGAQSWQPLAEVRTFGGLALGPGQGELWLGDAEGGLRRSLDRGETFTDVDDMRVNCLRVREQRVWICGNSAREPEAFSVGYTDDSGESFTSVMRFDEVMGILECGGTPVEGCDTAWDGFSFWNGGQEPAGEPDAAVAAPDAAVATIDAGAEVDAATTTSRAHDGCSCRTAAPGDAGTAALALLALWARRRRR